MSVENIETSPMYEQSSVVRNLDARLERLRSESHCSIIRIEDRLDSLSRELRSLRDEVASERSSAQLRRWFFLLMLLSAVLNLAVIAMPRPQ
jgi:hypothetical protein